MPVLNSGNIIVHSESSGGYDVSVYGNVTMTATKINNTRVDVDVNLTLWMVYENHFRNDTWVSRIRLNDGSWTGLSVVKGSTNGKHPHRQYGISYKFISPDLKSAARIRIEAREVLNANHNHTLYNFKGFDMTLDWDYSAPTGPNMSITVLNSSTTPSSIVATYSRTSGGAVDRVRWRINNGAWAEVATSASSGSRTFSSLLADTSYKIEVQGRATVKNDAGTQSAWGNTAIITGTTHPAIRNVSITSLTAPTPFRIDMSVSPSPTTRVAGYQYRINGGSAVSSSNTSHSFSVNPETTYTVGVRVQTSVSNAWSNWVERSVITPSDQASGYVKISGSWRKGKVFGKVGGSWRVADTASPKVGGSWRVNNNN